MSARARYVGAVLFAATMGIFEAAVAVYLWRLWELGEIDLTSASLSDRVIRVEILREGASLAMIASVAFLTGRRLLERFAYGAVIFGLWDLVYYATLRLMKGFPASLLDWDVLFLIPRPWIGPVLAPVLVSVALVLVGTYVLLREARQRPFRISPVAWIVSIAGGIVVIASFVMTEVPLSPTDAMAGFSWMTFTLGLLLGIGGFFLALLPKTELRER